MKTALVLISLAAASFAADPKPVKAPDVRQPSEQTGETKRLGSVTWNLESHQLVWVVQTGSMVNGEFVATSEEKYAISPDEARMIVSGEERGFDGQEAMSLHKILDVLSLYCAQSVVWWDDGQGTPATPSNRPKTDSKDGKPVKVGHPDDVKKPPYKAPAGHIVARAWF